MLHSELPQVQEYLFFGCFTGMNFIDRKPSAGGKSPSLHSCEKRFQLCVVPGVVVLALLWDGFSSGDLSVPFQNSEVVSVPTSDFLVARGFCTLLGQWAALLAVNDGFPSRGSYLGTLRFWHPLMDFLVM